MRYNIIYKFTYLLTLSILLSQLLISDCLADKINLKLSLSEAITRALNENEDVKKAQNEVRRTKLQYQEALATILPHLNVETTYNYYPGVPEVEIELPGQPAMTVPLQKENDLTVSATVTQTIVSFGKVSHALKAAQQAKNVSKHNKDQVIIQNAYSTSALYFAALLAIQQEKIARESYYGAIKNQNALEKKFALGRIPRGDNIKAKADISMRVPNYTQAQNDRQVALQNLKSFLGISQKTNITLTTGFTNHFPNYNTENSIQKLHINSSNLKMMKASLKLQDRIAKLYRAQMLPTIAAYGNYSYLGQGDETLLGDGYFQHLGTLGVKMTIPIWNGGENISRYKQSKIDKANTALTLQQTQKNLELILQNAINTYNNLIKTYQAHKNAIYLSQESYKSSFDQFASGQASLLALNDAELQLTSAKLNAAISLYQINMTIAQIESLITKSGES